MNSIEEELQNILNAPVSHHYFDKVTSLVKNDGLWMEFGVYSGSSINIISSKTTNKVYGFDSFFGLPEEWRDGHPKGSFNREGNPPAVNKNVELVVGLFQDTLDDFLDKHKENVAYLHLDADIYSSTKYVLDKLKTRIVKDTVISFDEIYNYNEYAEHEIKAWVEFSNENNVKCEWVYRTDYVQATCIVLGKKPRISHL